MWGRKNRKELFINKKSRIKKTGKNLWYISDDFGPSDKELKLNVLIDAWYRQLDLHNKIYNSLNTKLMWFFAFVSTIQWYLLVNFFLSKRFLEYNVVVISLFVIVITIWLLILGYYIYLLRLRTFYTGPDILRQTKTFWSNEKDVFWLKFDTLWTLNDSYKRNSDTISSIWIWFKRILYSLFIYFILIIIYFLSIMIMSEKKTLAILKLQVIILLLFLITPQVVSIMNLH